MAKEADMRVVIKDAKGGFLKCCKTADRIIARGKKLEQ